MNLYTPRSQLLVTFLIFGCISRFHCFDDDLSKQRKDFKSSEQITLYCVRVAVGEFANSLLEAFRKLSAFLLDWFFSVFGIRKIDLPQVDGHKSGEHDLKDVKGPKRDATNMPADVLTDDNNATADVSFYHALIASFSVIVVSELGDKTWFIAAIMAMRHSRLTIFCGAMSALALMTVLSALLGYATQVIPRALTYYISTALFALFGLKMLYEGWHMSSNEGHEVYEESNAEIQKKELLRESGKVADLESGVEAGNRSKTYVVLSFVSILFLEAFTLTFLAEWGDRSQLTTIILAARENVYGVVLGGVTGHALCTGIAVIGGKLIATRISVRTVTLVGGVVFIIFALSAFFINPQ